jgi:Fe-S-cluster containining protein
MGNIVCRIGCGACCIAPSLSSAIPGMPDGKPAGVPCVQLTLNNSCSVYGKPERPAVCASYQAQEEFCGTNQGDALRILEELELMTRADIGTGEGSGTIDG